MLTVTEKLQHEMLLQGNRYSTIGKSEFLAILASVLKQGFIVCKRGIKTQTITDNPTIQDAMPAKVKSDPGSFF